MTRRQRVAAARAHAAAIAARRSEVGTNPALVLALLVAVAWPATATILHRIDPARAALTTATTIITILATITPLYALASIWTTLT